MFGLKSGHKSRLLLAAQRLADQGGGGGGHVEGFCEGRGRFRPAAGQCCRSQTSRSLDSGSPKERVRVELFLMGQAFVFAQSTRVLALQFRRGRHLAGARKRVISHAPYPFEQQ